MLYFCDICLQTVPLLNIRKYISKQGKEYIKAPDPRNPLHAKIFSAAELYGEKKKLGYINVILESKTSENVISTLSGNHISSLAITAFPAIIILSLLIIIFYFTRIRKSFDRIIDVLQRFEGGLIQVSIILDNQNLVFSIANIGKPLPEDLLRWINNLKASTGLLN